MTSAVLPAAPASVSSTYGCRPSFGRDAAAEESSPVASSSPARPAVATPAISKDFIDFEFSFGGCTASMLPADELFADGKLLPLQKDAAAVASAAPEPETAAAAPPPRLLEAMPATPEPMKAIRGGAAAGAADQYVFSPKAPSCSSRWRELLGLKRAAASAQSPKASSSPSPSPSAALAKTPGRTNTTTSSAARSLKFLLQRSNGGRASSGAASDLASAPLLRDSSDSEASLSLASSRFSHSSSSSSGGGHDHDDLANVNPRFSLDSAAPDHNNPPRLRLVPHRHSTSTSTRRPGPSTPPPPPPPSSCVTADSPRMNSSGKIVFQTTGLERSCSSPCSLHAAARSRSMARAVDRSYSSGVRVAPVVLNVPVCSRPVFGGFFKDKTKEAAANKDSAAAAARSSARASTLGRKPTPQRWSGELPKHSG
ncbi:suppressor protein SRP40-like [Lolium rigidum]|uniref:suppressor protein SRP40-like n=1 Tax=Lolium rigidum TaxID=89674 RepID=UPI001F5C2A92|nr:suppressor protein SRP40-like [Lolium rigidum]